MAGKIYAGDIFKCEECELEIRVIQAAKETEREKDTKFICCGKEMEIAGGLDPANSW